MSNILAICANVLALPFVFFYDVARLVVAGKPKAKTLGGNELV